MPTFNNGAGYFLYVKDISEVYAYNVPQGNTMFFMNKDHPILYLKAVNMFNQQTVTIYELVEKPQQLQPQQNFQPIQQPNQENDYVTKSELQSIIADTIRKEMRGNRRQQNNRNEDNV